MVGSLILLQKSQWEAFDHCFKDDWFYIIFFCLPFAFALGWNWFLYYLARLHPRVLLLRKCHRTFVVFLSFAWYLTTKVILFHSRLDPLYITLLDFLSFFFLSLRCHSTHPWRLHKLSLFTEKHPLRLFLDVFATQFDEREAGTKGYRQSSSPCFQLDVLIPSLFFFFVKFKIDFISTPTTTTTINSMTFEDI